ncbi:MAG: type II toxin-antitoxin system MqsA family antitoxin [Rhodobacteraceae bacterium]|nr:type II toxin-antitoxin system MqsA family antitoxin [Paracoccaceae bacterium]
MTHACSNMDAAPIQSGAMAQRIVCDRCTDSPLRASRISTAFWQGDGLVVLRNIPAMICPACGEEYVDDATVVALDRMRGNGFAGCVAADPLPVPVFDFAGMERCGDS